VGRVRWGEQVEGDVSLCVRSGRLEVGVGSGWCIWES
jgi:hypothetical protein